jgi:hypothetical protein
MDVSILKLILDAGVSVVAITSLVFIVVRQMKLFEGLEKTISENTQVTKELTTVVRERLK